ncbi:MAG: ferritin [Candidatus Melainabacteria bacterium]|nr:MAG: ferritin [Candidatus Melainabacteria bacterium]
MNSEAVEDLNALLKGELSAVETYNQALPKVGNKEIASVLSDCLESHKARVGKLTDAIRDFGGTPEADSGIWGSWAKILSGGASVFGDDATVAALEQEEDAHSSDYEWRLVKMHGVHRDLVKNELMPEQQRYRTLLANLLNAEMNGKWPPTPVKDKEI